MTYMISLYKSGDKHPYATHRADRLDERADGSLLLEYEGCTTIIDGDWAYFTETAFDLSIPEDVALFEKALEGLSNLEAQLAASAQPPNGEASATVNEQ